MAVELLVGLHVSNPELYAEYRRQMTPLLHQHQGDFGCDFIVQQSLKPADSAINRVFTIYFVSQELMDSFFNHPDYLAIRQQYFQPAVAASHILASYQKAD
ncbi:DUF1330 domain-containing protein [Rheinheimera soli]|uniref:DUF1330 domain-containing protein n=1 Tax=Rheinheimera soli TaxID=443616 RepID=UPI001E40296F|nr:DUF1330 domain-containing protein [Rheinheimera soli]